MGASTACYRDSFSFICQSQSHIATDGQSVCLGVEPRLWLMTRYFFLFESYCPVHVGRPLWREDGSTICQSHSQQYSVNCQYVQLFTFYLLLTVCIYIIHKGLCQSRLSTADYALFLVASAITAV
jgi:hypothetical protein